MYCTKMITSSEQLEFDYVILVCNGCKLRQKHYPDRAIKGSAEMIEWMNSVPKKFCNCPSQTCDIMAHIKGMPQIPVDE